MPNIIKLTPSLCGCSPIQIGYRVENDARAIEFDFTEWSDEYGSGAVELLVKRKGDQAAYPVALEIDGTVATWNISDTDTSVPGYGKAEYTYTVGTTLAKTAVFAFFVAEDLADTTQDPPDPYQTWVDTLTELGAETLGNAIRAEDAADRAEDAQAAAEQTVTEAAQYAQDAETSATNAAQSAGAARDMAASALQSADRSSAAADRAEQALEEFTTPTASAETLPEGSDATASYADGHFTFGIPRGATGATGPQGPQGEKGEQGDKGDKGDTGEVDLSMIYPFLPTDTASGSIASFPDGADDVPIEALTVSLEPVQDLHGQASPYPAGGGKNKFLFSDENRTATLNGMTCTFDKETEMFTVTGTETRGSAFGLLINSEDFHIPNFVAGETYTASIVPTSGSNNDKVYFQLSYKTTSSTNRALVTLRENASFTVPSDFDYVYNAFIGIYAGATDLNYSFKVQIESGSTATTFAPYSNLCPITGHTQCEVWRAGVNVWDEQWVNGFINDSGVFTARNDIVGTKNAISVKPNTTYAFVRPNVQGFVTFWKKAEAYNELVTTDFISRRSLSASVGTFTAPDNCYAVHFNLVAAYGSSYANNVSVNYPSTNTTYIAHKPIVNIEIPLGQTVYGGSIDVVEGVLTVDRAIDTITKDGAWYGFATGTGNSSAVIQLAEYQNVLYVDGSSSHNGAISSTGSEEANYWVNARQNEMPTAGDMCFAYSATGQLRFHRLDVATIIDIASFKANFPDTQVCYKLATPITIDLTDIPELTTLYGTNNIWSDSGDVDVTYRADIQKYIAKVIAEAIS